MLFSRIQIMTFFALGINFLPGKFQTYPLALISIILTTIVEWGIVRQIDDAGTTLVEDMADLKSDFLVPCFTDSKYSMPDFFGAQDVFIKVYNQWHGIMRGGCIISSSVLYKKKYINR